MNRKSSVIAGIIAIIAVQTPFPALAKDSVDQALAKLPTQQQMDGLLKIDQKFTEIDEKISHEANDLGQKIDDAMQLPGVQFTRSHIDAAMVIHKKMRIAYSNYFDDVIGWAKKSNRPACLRQAEKTNAYMMIVSDHWLVRVAGLPLATPSDRILAATIVLSGGGETFRPANSDPIRHGVAREIMGLGAVCMGSQNEYQPDQAE